MAVLTKDQILGAKDLVIEKVEIPEWNGHVNVKSLTGKERDQFEESIFHQKGKKMERNFRNLRAKLVALTTVDDDGNLIFNQNDVEALGDKNASALDKIFSKAQKLSGLTKEDIEEMTASLEDGQSDGSSSD